MSLNYPVHTIPKKEWKALVGIQMNQEQLELWENCYYDDPPGDVWLINLFANEYYYLKNGNPDNSRLVTDFNC